MKLRINLKETIKPPNVERLQRVAVRDAAGTSTCLYAPDGKLYKEKFEDGNFRKITDFATNQVTRRGLTEEGKTGFFISGVAINTGKADSPEGMLAVYKKGKKTAGFDSEAIPKKDAFEKLWELWLNLSKK